MVIDYKSETVKSMNMVIDYTLVIIDYKNVKRDPSEKHAIDYIAM